MLATTPMSVFKDCTIQDMLRYFQHTCLLWNLSNTKRRIYVPEAFDSISVTGNYLTREKEWKPKSFKLEDWGDDVEIISMEPRVFNLKTAAAVWSPALQQNFKKSFIYNVSYVKFFGKPAPEETYTQELVFRAFGEIYAQPTLPTLDYALREKNRTYVFTREGFGVDFGNQRLLYHNVVVGALQKDGGIKILSPHKFMQKLIKSNTTRSLQVAA